MSRPAPYSRTNSLFSEARRRRVPRAVAAYAMAAFVVLQAADLLLPALPFPDWTYTWVVVLVLLGLPVVLVLAWMLEITPHGLRRTEAPAAAATPAASAAQDATGIVVLPFANLSPDVDTDYFADGLVDEIITDLSAVRALRVISRTSAMTLRGTQKAVREIGRELNVRYVLEGSVRRAGDDLRITAQLIEASTDTHLWADRYAGKLRDVFSIQEELSRAIVDALSVWLGPAERARIEERPVADVRAYECLLRARHDMYSFSREALDRAVAALDAALAIEPDNALLLATRGFVHRNRAVAGIDAASELEAAESFAARAAAVDPGGAQVLMLEGVLRAARADIAGAIHALSASVELEPNNPPALAELTRFLVETGQEDRADPLGQRLLELDPLTPITYGIVGYIKWGRGDFDAALSDYRKAFEIAPDQPFSGLFYGCALARAGYPDPAAAVLRQTYETFPHAALGQFARFFGSAVSGDRAAALAAATPLVLEACRPQSYLARDVAVSYGLIGENDEALEWLRHTIEIGFVNYPFITEHDPLLKPLRSDPRFAAVAEVARQYWRAHHQESVVMSANSR